MENKKQYTQPESSGEVPVTKPKQITTRTPSDIKIQQLEEQIALQQQEIFKLHRHLSRLKSDVSDIVTTLRNRG